MSIKIRSGIVFSNPSVDALVADAPVWRERIKELTAQAKATWLADRAIAHLDARALGEAAPASQGPLARAWRDYHEDVANEARGLRHPETDFEFLLTLMPFEERLYGIVRTEKHQWLAEYVSRPGVNEFDYWDDTEGPEDVTTEEWNERRRVWLGALQLRSGLSLDYSWDTGTPTETEILGAQPTFERRLNRAAMDRTREFFMREVAAIPEGAGMGEIISAANRADDWIQSPSGRVEYARAQDRVAAILPRGVTIEMLRA